MPLPRDLLEQANHLASRESRRPKQASLRRAVSSAYYALFHLLVQDAASAAAPSLPRGLRDLTSRALGHAEMKSVCKSFVGANNAFTKSAATGKAFRSSDILPAMGRLLAFPLEPDLIAVVSAFVVLQELRHLADYVPRRPGTEGMFYQK